MKATGWKMAIGLGAIAGAIGYARARARRRQAVPVTVRDDGDTQPYHGIAPVDPQPMTHADTSLPEELRTILSPGFAPRSRHP